MQTAPTTPAPAFSGSDEEQQIAQQIFQVMRASGRFFSPTAPIRVTASSLAAFLASRSPEQEEDEWRQTVERVVRHNPETFALEEQGDQLLVITTSAGLVPREQQMDQDHTLARRLQEPIPRPEKVPADRRVTAPSFTTVAPETETIVEPETPVEPEKEVEPHFEVQDDDVANIDQVEPWVEPEPVVVAKDLNDVDDEILAHSLAVELRADLTVANFGDLWMSEDKVPRLSRGDLRRIRDYILERNVPLEDETLLQDILGVRSGADNYDLMRFAVNFRLSRETREFEFVGTSDQRLWSTTGLPAIGTTKRKPSELGQDYRFLLTEPPIEPSEEAVVEHVLTFYEYQYGVLPYGGDFATLFPGPMQPEQRSAALMFESPQTFETFVVELRYPTGNRGGYVAGFERFFLENLVPGALLTIERSQNNGRYLIEYLPVSGEDRKLLQIDEKKNRYVFRPMTFYCATQAGMVLSENRFPQLANGAPLDDRARRRPELVLASTFERIGEQVGTTTEPRLMAVVDDLYVVANIERPLSANLIKKIASSPENPEFSADPDVEDVYYYEPPRKS